MKTINHQPINQLSKIKKKSIQEIGIAYSISSINQYLGSFRGRLNQLIVQHKLEVVPISGKANGVVIDVLIQMLEIFINEKNPSPTEKDRAIVLLQHAKVQRGDEENLMEVKLEEDHTSHKQSPTPSFVKKRKEIEKDDYGVEKKLTRLGNAVTSILESKLTFLLLLIFLSTIEGVAHAIAVQKAAPQLYIPATFIVTFAIQSLIFLLTANRKYVTYIYKWKKKTGVLDLSLIILGVFAVYNYRMTLYGVFYENDHAVGSPGYWILNLLCAAASIAIFSLSFVLRAKDQEAEKK